MARQIDIISLETGKKYLLFGFNAEEIADFSIQIWITKYGARLIDFVQAMGLNFITFMGGDLWIHNDEDQDRCNLFGEKRDCIVGVVTNENPTEIKLLDSIGIHSNGTWEIVSITIPPNLNYPQGMESRIPVSMFKKRDGVWKARFLRNLKSTSDTASVIDALNGEVLRGYEAYLTLKNTSNEQIKLFKVDINSTLSRV